MPPLHQLRPSAPTPAIARHSPTIDLPAYEEVSGDDAESKRTFCTITKISHQETNPHNAKRLVQFHGPEAVVVNPGALPLTQAEMDRVYGLPFTRLPHPSYGREKIPAYDVVKHSVQIMRGCFGGCTFCSITAHEGRIIQSRSQESVLAEIERMRETQPDFTGVVSDIGGPTANMYQMRCTRPEVEAVCRRLSCVHPTICKLLGTDHGPLIDLMQKVPRAARREKSAGRLRHPHGPGPPRSGLHARTGPAPRRRPSESRPRTHRPRRAGHDEKTLQRRFRKVRRSSSQRNRKPPAKSSTSSRTTSPAIPAAT